MSELQTMIVKVDPLKPDDKILLPAAELLRAGKLVAFPTETVYGLGANALNPEAVRAIFAAKGRPADNPLIVHVAKISDLEKVVREISPLARLLMEKFMPGPLTLVLPRSELVPDVVTAGLDTVAVRLPEHPVARRLIELASVPVAAPSANRSGRPSPTLAEHVLEDMNGRIPLIVDGGPSDFGVESTVLDVTGSVPVILRPGAVTIEELQAVAGTVLVAGASPAPALNTTPRSPGMKYRHYAPGTPLCIAEGENAEARSDRVLLQVLASIKAGRTPAVFASSETKKLLQANLPAGWQIRNAADRELRNAVDLDPAVGLDTGDAVNPEQCSEKTKTAKKTVWLVVHGPGSQARTAASHLFAGLRWLDSCHADLIIVESADNAGIGVAYLNRLRKAAGGGSDPLTEHDCQNTQKTKKEVAMKILFICTGNTCRSPMAACLFNHFAAGTGYTAESAGLAARNGDSISENARLVLKELYGIDAGDHHSRLFELEMAAGFDLILTMNSIQRDFLRSQLPSETEKIQTIGEAAGVPAEAVSDPFGRERSVYEKTARQLERLIKEIIKKLPAIEAE